MPPRDNDLLESPVQHQPQDKHRSRKSQSAMNHPSGGSDRKPKKKSSSSRRDKDQAHSEQRSKSKSKDGRTSKSSHDKHHHTDNRNRNRNRNDGEIVAHPKPQRQAGVTVSSFLSKQKSMQREMESYRSNSVDAGSKAMMLTNGDSDHLEYKHSPVSSKSPTVDTVPSDHPSSSVIQTHRTCTLCHRTLSRSQFSERDRYLVHLSLGPGAVCRTCSMTVAAAKLKMMPSHGQLLVDYANRGEYLVRNGQLPALGYGPLNRTAAEGALVLHNINTVTGNELVPFQPGMYNNTQQNPFMTAPSPVTMGVDVNAPFSGILPEEERPTHIADCKYVDAVLSMPCYAKLNSMELYSSSKDVSVSMAALDAVKLYGTVESEYFVPHDGNGEKVIPRNTRKKINASPQNENNVNPKSIVCLVIGEGSLPRTAVMASLHLGWTTLSIDPTISEDWDGYQDDVPNYTGYSGTISEFMTDEYTESYFELNSSQSGVHHLVIIGMQTTKDEMRLKGRSNINEIRARYDDVPTTLVSMSPLRKATLAPKRRDGQCGSKLEKDVGYEPNCSYIDEGVFSACRLVEVWNFHNEDQGSDEEGSHEEEYEEESIDAVLSREDGDDPREDEQHRFSKEEQSLENMLSGSNDSVYMRFKEHAARIESDRKGHDVEQKRYARKNTKDSLSTLSTKEMIPLNDPIKKRSSTRHLERDEKANESNGALALGITSLLEKENSRRKSKAARRQKKSYGPRPIPNDIPENLEISSDSFVGQGPPQTEHRGLVEWNAEQTYDKEYHERNANDVISERINSYTDKGGRYKIFDNPMEELQNDTWKGVVANCDDHLSRSDKSDEYSAEYEEDEADMHGDLDANNVHDEQGPRSVGSDAHRRTNKRDNQNSTQVDESSSGDAFEDAVSKRNICDNYSSESDEYCGKEERNDSDLRHGDDQDDAHSDDGNEQGLNQSDRSEEVDTFNGIRRSSQKQKNEYFALNRDDENSAHSSNYVYDDGEDQTSTNSGIAALNDINALRNNIGQICEEEEYDAFPNYWSDDDDLRTPGGSSPPQKLKPWHTKEQHGNSFMSYESYD